MNTRKIAIYSRKSKFTGKGESIENQIEFCRQYISIHFEGVLVHDILIYEDEGFSGGNTARPQFLKMLSDIKKGIIHTVVCYRLDRISRNVSDFANLKNELDKRNVGFVSIRDNFDTTTSVGNAMMMMVAVFAQLERDTIAERIRDNMNELSKTGRWLGGTTPTGYKSEKIERITSDGKTRSLYKLDLIPEEVRLVKLIYDKFLETNSLTQTETYLLQNHIQTKNKRQFTRFSIKSILQNPVYMIADEAAWEYFEKLHMDVYADKSDFNGKNGIMAYNKTVQTKGKANELRDMKQWIVAVGKHEGIIDGNTWTKVQGMLLQNKSKSYRKPKSNVALLSGLIVCGNCGDYMRPKLSARLNKDGEKIFSYLCETKEKSKLALCDLKNPNGNILDKLVCEEIRKLSSDHSQFLKQLENAKKQIACNSQEYDKELDNLKKELTNIESQIKVLVITLSKAEGTNAYSYISAEIDEMHNKKLSIENRIGEIKDVTRQTVLKTSEFDVLKEILSSFSQMFDKMDTEAKRSALRLFIKKIVWDGENAHIYFWGTSEPLRYYSK